MLCTRTGQVLHRNGRFEEMLRGDLEREKIAAEADVLVRSLVLVPKHASRGDDGQPLIVLNRELATSSSRYRLRGVCVTEEGAGADPVMLVILERILPEPLTARDLKREYGLAGYPAHLLDRHLHAISMEAGASYAPMRS